MKVILNSQPSETRIQRITFGWDSAWLTDFLVDRIGLRHRESVPRDGWRSQGLGALYCCKTVMKILVSLLVIVSRDKQCVGHLFELGLWIPQKCWLVCCGNWCQPDSEKGRMDDEKIEQMIQDLATIKTFEWSRLVGSRFPLSFCKWIYSFILLMSLRFSLGWLMALCKLCGHCRMFYVLVKEVKFRMLK